MNVPTSGLKRAQRFHEAVLGLAMEVLTTDVDAICTLYSQMHGMIFGDADPSLGGARTARLANGRLLSVRAPRLRAVHGHEPAGRR